MDHTASVISATGSNASPPVHQVFASLVSHLHDCIRENKVTVDEWMGAAVIQGVVRLTNGSPIEGAKIEVWHTAPNGLYEQQDPEQPEYNLRGNFYTDKDGVYYELHPFRPGHIHFLVSSPGHRQLVTQIFDSKDPYVEKDSVFAVKNELIVEFP
ncbi:Intradiol ring-cleavage dioxygenase [Lipomyces starkeyi]